MTSPFHHPLATSDQLNQDIWHNLQAHPSDALSRLNPSKYSIELIQAEIQSGCSPGPDILTPASSGQPA